MNILPYSELRFFIGIFAVILILNIFKNIFKKIIPYSILLFILTIGYNGLCFEHKIANAILLFLFYSYFIYWLSGKIKLENPLYFSIIIAIPMMLYKLDIGNFYRILGISYITFRTIQAIVDYKNYGKLSFIEFAVFLLFPPTILAGPIDRSHRFKKDLDKGYDNLNINRFINGWEIFLIGVLFKFVFGEITNIFWLSKIDIHSTSFLDMANSAYAYSVYLFFDFAGYSAMAVGIGKMLGIDVPMNFDKPYLSKNPQEFWRRFHITLGSWLTDYIFKPLYKTLHKVQFLKGKRLFIQNISIIITFLFMGIWNGLTWYYVFSGFLFGIYSAIHNTYVNYVRKGGNDIFSYMPNLVSINTKRFIMLNAAVFSLYFFSGRVPI